MKPFDLEAALKGEPVVNREGKKVSDFRLTNHFPLEARNSNGVLELFSLEGHFYLDERVSPFDLFMAPKKVKKSGWMNIYKCSSSPYSLGVYTGLLRGSKEEALMECSKKAGLLKTIKIFW